MIEFVLDRETKYNTFMFLCSYCALVLTKNQIYSGECGIIYNDIVVGRDTQTVQVGWLKIKLNKLMSTIIKS